MFLPLLVPKSRRQACAGNVVGSKGQVLGHTPFCGLPDSVSAPPTIFSARHFFHKFSRNISDLESNSRVLHTLWHGYHHTASQSSCTPIHTTWSARDVIGCVPSLATASSETVEPHLSSFRERRWSQKNEYMHTHSSVLPIDGQTVWLHLLASPTNNVHWWKAGTPYFQLSCQPATEPFATNAVPATTCA